MIIIPPQIFDVKRYEEWKKNSHVYLDRLMECRENAIALLGDPIPAARSAAIESFKFVWCLDGRVVNLIVGIAVQDVDNLVRFIAAGALVIAHVRASRMHGAYLKHKVIGITRAPGQIPEIIAEIGLYISIDA